MSDEIARELADWMPNPGDRLFVATDTGARLDPLGLTARGEERHPAGRWQLYAGGFLSAADQLVDGCRDHAYEDELIYPILTLYRHHLELQLKYVLRCCPDCTENLRQWLCTKHSLVALWNRLAEIYPRFSEWASAGCTTVCQELIAEFDEHDPKSQAGRYPVDRQERPTLTRLEIVDLQALRLGVHKVSHYLGTIIEQIGEDREWEAEMASW